MLAVSDRTLWALTTPRGSIPLVRIGRALSGRPQGEPGGQATPAWATHAAPRVAHATAQALRDGLAGDKATACRGGLPRHKR